jgi:hypothetical protein
MPAPPKGGAPTDRSRSPAKSVNAAADAAARSLASRAPVGNTPGRPGKTVMQGGLGMTAFGQNNAMSGRNVSRNSSLPALTGGRSKDQSRLPSPANKDQSRLPAAPKDQARLQQGSGFLKPPNWPKDQARLPSALSPAGGQPYAGFTRKDQTRLTGTAGPLPSRPTYVRGADASSFVPGGVVDSYTPPRPAKDQARLMAGPTQPQPYAGFAAGKIKDRIAPGPSYAIPAQPIARQPDIPAPTPAAGYPAPPPGYDPVDPPPQQNGASEFAEVFSRDLNAIRNSRGGKISQLWRLR